MNVAKWYEVNNFAAPIDYLVKTDPRHFGLSQREFVESFMEPLYLALPGQACNLLAVTKRALFTPASGGMPYHDKISFLTNAAEYIVSWPDVGY